jgi:hypothetical protein
MVVGRGSMGAGWRGCIASFASLWISSIKLGGAGGDENARVMCVRHSAFEVIGLAAFGAGACAWARARQDGQREAASFARQQFLNS